MTDKERLQEIKSYFKKIVDEKRNVNPHLNADDIEFLIEQAERVQGLESRIADDEHFVHGIMEQNKRYREALKEISVSHWANEFAKSKALQALDDNQRLTYTHYTKAKIYCTSAQSKKLQRLVGLRLIRLNITEPRLTGNGWKNEKTLGITLL